jgi:uridine kinase
MDAKDAKVLLVSFLLSVFLPRGSFPILALSGGQGSGQTTLTRRIQALVDPNQAPARQRPRSEDDLIIASANGAILAFDNLSNIDSDLSDALCRLATGAGFTKRRLYSDADEIIVEVRRPVIINGIADLVRMPDLADRALFIDLPKRKLQP